MDKTVHEFLSTVNLSAATRNAHQEVVNLRRELHRIPEFGLKEYKTAEYIEARLTELNVPHARPTETGVVALIDSGQEGPTVMLRADMDALPVSEETGHDFVSTHDGYMHACGHDTHMAILLAVAKRLKEEGLGAGRIKLVFQPGEEGRHGAEQLIAAGVLENPKVDVAYAQHVWAQEPTGLILVEQGPVMAAVDTVHVKIHGKGTHAAMPQGGVDPIYAGAQIVSALQSVVTRSIDPLEPGVVTVSEFHAGTAHNVIPELAQLTLSVRVFDDETHATMERRIHEIISGVAGALGCRAEIDYVHEHQPTINDPQVTQLVREEAAAIVGAENVVGNQRTMGAEDFSDFLRQVPGAFAFFGAKNEAKDCVYPHHHPKFNVDEDALAIGAELMYRMARRLLIRE